MRKGEQDNRLLEELFQYFHTHPETSWEEVNTTEYIKGFFNSYGCEVNTFDDCTGLTADIGQGKPIIALRADIDALWQDLDGKFRANHSCGHDAHMTIALGVFLKLIEDKEQLKGTVRFIFQPAEEKGTGALKFVEKGIVDDVDYLYGMHLRPVQELADGEFSSAISHGAARFVSGIIEGVDAHGARPHLNTNAIQVGAELVQAMNNMHFDPSIAHSMKMTSFHAGGKSTNIIPEKATFSLDLRAQQNELIEEMMERLERTVKSLSDYHQISIKIEVDAFMQAAIINEHARGLMEGAIYETQGAQSLRPVVITTGGDDFHFYTIKRPELKASMLAIGCDLKPGLHHPWMTFNQKIIPDAVKVLTKVIENTILRSRQR
ncbi:M20 peptidase aminoacylase family protein [Salipaludibacillus sp. HK11]|uniref:M20 peptidase aminoacylase family protein n=1 Tax=Salipaludibacillus sp. HK11 TaxID=3394320 RepID=UPI0039FDCC42